MGFGNFLTSDSGGKVIGGVLDLGGGLILSNQQKQALNKQAQIEADKAKSQLALAQLQLENTRAQAQNVGAKPSGNTMLYVGLGIGAVVLLGVVIFAVTRKKSE